MGCPGVLVSRKLLVHWFAGKKHDRRGCALGEPSIVYDVSSPGRGLDSRWQAQPISLRKPVCTGCELIWVNDGLWLDFRFLI